MQTQKPNRVRVQILEPATKLAPSKSTSITLYGTTLDEVAAAINRAVATAMPSEQRTKASAKKAVA